MSEWIPVSKVLPEDGKDVLVSDRYGSVDIMHRYSGKDPYSGKNFSGWDDRKDWCLSDEGAKDSSFAITAWMPPPDPYEGNE